MSFRVPKRRISATLQLDGSSKVQTNRRVSTPSLQPLEDMVICPIDLNLLDDPRLLPCGHAFCCECLTHYMHQLPTPTEGHKDSPTHGTTFACPICRTSCPIPTSKSASVFPKAFNHIVILEFLRKNQQCSFNLPSNLGAGNGEGLAGKTRKTSIQVSSQMLSYIVSDISAREREGKMGPTDRAIILDDITTLIQKLHAEDAIVSTKQLSFTPPIPTPSAPMGSRRNSSTPSTASPAGSHRNFDRFNAFAAKVRGSRRFSKAVELPADFSNYTSYRDAENVRLAMKNNAVYRILSKGKDCCIMRLGEIHQPVDMRLLQPQNTMRVVRCTLTTDEKRTSLMMWKQPVNAASHLSSHRCRNGSGLGTLIQLSGLLKVDGCGPLKVQYLRFYKDQIYLTAVTPSGLAQISPNGIVVGNGESQCSDRQEFGLVVCCNMTDLDPDDDSQSVENGLRNLNPFPVLSTSCIFRRDSVGLGRLDQPILFGLDIDQSTGDLYVAQPANGMICRLKSSDLSSIDGTWYLNEPQLSPYFLCYAEISKQIWSTCQREDKIAILDLETDGYHHFNPASSFGITPSHIIYTSDGRIVMLDTSQSRLFWISKVHQTICVQCLDVQFSNRVHRQILVLQPVSDMITDTLLKSKKRNKKTPHGGILCAHDYGCSVICPKQRTAEGSLMCYNVSRS